MKLFITAFKRLWENIFRPLPDENTQSELPFEVCGFQRGELMRIDEEVRNRQSALEEKLRLNAEIVFEHLSQHAGFELGFNEESVEWIDGFVERQRVREGFEPGGMINTIGSFLGECMCRELGGEWKQQSNGQLAVQFSSGTAAFPFNKVQKHFDNGEEDSIFSFYQSTRVLFGMQKRTTLE